ncbi:hypothetical protein [uncultured Bacteroides sp.]|uniref:hypothetical protein n=1 Tax=uncultured Bacteroides sp. TaxID=162156 RepID=UPI0025DAC589|nr:hypothetical protein [uncultured Bacteroides sp.]
MKNEGIEKTTSGMKQCSESFTKSQKQLREAINNPNASKLQAAIDSKREIGKQERIKELELQNKDLEERINKSQKNQVWIAILSAIIGAAVTFLLQKFLQ